MSEKSASLAKNSLTPIESYSVVRDRGLLRWSLWEAGKKKCYICEEATDFKDIHIDHVIPQSQTNTEFDKLWTIHGGQMANLGVHHISNLRACCKDCNSARLKGKKVFSSSLLDLHLQNSPSVMKDAFRVQNRIRRNGDIGESLVKVATADAPDEYNLLWDFDLNQAVIAAFHAGSNRFAKGSAESVNLYINNRLISLQMNAERLRMLAAVQLTTGVSVSRLIAESVACAVEVSDAKASELVSMESEDFQGVSVGSSDWDRAAEFIVYVDEFNIDMESASCAVIVKLHEFITLPLAMQSEDGGTLEDSHQSNEMEVLGTIKLIATINTGHNPTGKSGLVVYVEDDRNLNVQ